MNTLVSRQTGSHTGLLRLELKYFLPLPSVSFLVQDLKHFMIYDSYARKSRGSYQVASLYYENHNLDVYHAKMSGLPYGFKFRIRFYPPLQSGSLIRIEMKGKKAESIFKNSTFISEDTLHHLLADKMEWQNTDKTLMGLGRAIRAGAYEPFIRIDYDRMAFVGRHDRSLRVTLDDKIICRRYARNFSKAPTIPLLDRSLIILEIKTPGHLPFWLQTIIKKYNLSRLSLSKYAMGVQAIAANSCFTVR